MSRDIWQYPRKEGGYRGTAERWGVAKSSGKKKRRKLLVHSTGKSGTKYLSKVFQHIGLDVQHEMVGEFGTVTHFFHTDHHWYPMFPWYEGRAHVGERRSDYEFEFVYILARHPLNVIASMVSSFDLMDFEFLESCQIISEDLPTKHLKAMHAYLNMNRRYLRECSRIIQLEDIGRNWHLVMKDLGMPEDTELPVLKPTNRNTGYRAPVPLSWEDLTKIDATLTYKLQSMAEALGYET